jgi:hypothetical protein
VRVTKLLVKAGKLLATDALDLVVIGHNGL